MSVHVHVLKFCVAKSCGPTLHGHGVSPVAAEANAGVYERELKQILDFQFDHWLSPDGEFFFLASDYKMMYIYNTRT